MGILLSLCVSLTLYFAIGDWGKDHWALIGMVGGILIVGTVGFIDDLKSLSPLVRLASHSLAAIIVVAMIGPLRSIDFPFLGTIRFGVLSVPISLIWIIAVTNIYNFMDGIDGLAAGEGVLAGCFLAYIGSVAGKTQVSAIGLFIATASLGFLLFNFPPAKIFMGDSGSTTLGFAFAAVAIIGAQSKINTVPFLVMALLLGSFLFDGTITLFRRALRREKLHEAHREHFYQQAVQLGYSHRQVTLSEYGLETMLGGSAIVYVLGHETVQLSLLLFWPFVFTIIGIWLMEKKKHQNA